VISLYFGRERNQNPDKRVPPNQNVTTTFPVLHAGNVPVYKNIKDWDLRIFGLVEQETSFTFEELMKLEQTNVHNDIHCVTGWSKLDNTWTGIKTKSLMENIRLQDGAAFVILHAEEGWSSNVPLDDFLKETTILAHSFEGVSLSPEHGYPLRAVIPHLYFWKSAKWIRGIEFTAEDRLGYWEKGGYHRHGDPFKEQRFSFDD
jgi:DMSO/TMAO reductase YedYZ molybdopterin-dependent catalytic subunit